MLKKIPYGKHYIDHDDIKSVIRALKSNNLTQGPLVEEYEEKFAKYVFDYINEVINKESNGRVRVLMVECFEGGTNNSAIYKPIKISSAVRVLKYNKETI